MNAAGRIRVQLTGAVQGVGMRPYVYRLASEFGLSGFVHNGPDGVSIEAEGRDLNGFLSRLTAEAPPLARIDALDVVTLPPVGDTGFCIGVSAGGAVSTRIVADAATCAACLEDLFDPESRFFQYPFVNCTHCGPRYTITRHLPYDRQQTSMAGFTMCPACAVDYTDPANRRFHAQPIACPACGPRLRVHAFATLGPGLAPIPVMIAALQAGKIVALKGIGGFHLMCDARNETAVAELRRRKARDAKPFAVMTQDLAAVALPTPQEQALAASSARPIVLMTSRPGRLAPSISPGLNRLGVMLPYAPVHHLLFAELPPGTVLVATSANPGGEPLVVDDQDAIARLSGIADLIVTHDRPIVVRADDSVAQVIVDAPALIRRARGYVPDPIRLASDGACVVALGGHLKSTVTVLRGREAFVSQHIGDLDTVETVRFWQETLAHLLDILDVTPEVVACDLHPDYRSTQFADTLGLPVYRVQHHAAHIAAIAAEHRLSGPVLGLALDGHGLGSDGGAWGGELLSVIGGTFRRIGSIEPLPQPGGDRAAREPWRMAVAALHRIGRADEAASRFPEQPLAAMLAARIASAPVTTSAGRLFDAAAALLGIRDIQAYEGQAAMELEARVQTPRALPGGYVLTDRLSFVPLLAALADQPEDGADLFHGTLIDGLAALAAKGATETGITTVCLGGGCLMNRVLAEGLFAALTVHGLKPLLARTLPPNDGGLSVGQAVMARALITEGN